MAAETDNSCQAELPVSVSVPVYISTTQSWRRLGLEKRAVPFKLPRRRFNDAKRDHVANPGRRPHLPVLRGISAGHTLPTGTQIDQAGVRGRDRRRHRGGCLIQVEDLVDLAGIGNPRRRPQSTVRADIHARDRCTCKPSTAQAPQCGPIADAPKPAPERTGAGTASAAGRSERSRHQRRAIIPIDAGDHKAGSANQARGANDADEHHQRTGAPTRPSFRWRHPCCRDPAVRPTPLPAPLSAARERATGRIDRADVARQRCRRSCCRRASASRARRNGRVRPITGRAIASNSRVRIRDRAAVRERARSRSARLSCA